MCRGYKSHCRSVPCLPLVVDLLLPPHCVKSFSSSPSNTSHWSLQRGCISKCWFNSVGKMGPGKLEEEDWQRLLKTTHLLISIGTRAITTPPLPFELNFCQASKWFQLEVKWGRWKAGWMASHTTVCFCPGAIHVLPRESEIQLPSESSSSAWF